MLRSMSMSPSFAAIDYLSTGSLGPVSPGFCASWAPTQCSGTQYGGGSASSYNWQSTNTTITPISGSSSQSNVNLYGQNIGSGGANAFAYAGSCQASSGGSATVTNCANGIGSPANGAVSSTTGGNSNRATMSLNPDSTCSTSANWSIYWYYTTGNGTTYTGSDDVTTPTNQSTNFSPSVGNGGEGSATINVGGALLELTLYLNGVSIAPANITGQLGAIYNGPHPHLLTGIAQVESSYQPFVNVSKYLVSGYWPNESYDGGSHVGLMQVPMNMQNAFDWTANMRAGSSLFTQKVASATNYSNAQVSSHPGLPALSGTQLEYDACVLYGPYGASGHYYVPNGTAWIVNPNNPQGVSYANSVFANMH